MSYEIEFRVRDDNTQSMVVIDQSYEYSPTWPVLADLFMRFLKGAGYVFKEGAYFDVPSNPRANLCTGGCEGCECGDGAA